MDLNDNIIDLNKAKDMINSHQVILDELKNGFSMFQDTTTESSEKIKGECNDFKRAFSRIESRFKQNEDSTKANDKRAN